MCAFVVDIKLTICSGCPVINFIFCYIYRYLKVFKFESFSTFQLIG